MKIIDQGLEKRILNICAVTSEDKAVKFSEEQFDKYFSMIEQQIGLTEELKFLESAVSQMRFAEMEAGYRIGVSDGMQLQQEVNSLILN